MRLRPVMLAVLAVTLAMPPVARGTYPGSNGLIAYDQGELSCGRVRSRLHASDCHDVYDSSGTRLIALDGSHRQRLEALGPGVFSPGGRYLATDDYGYNGIRVVRLGGRSSRAVTHGQYDIFGSWSPGGQTILYDHLNTVRRIDRYGKHNRLLVRNASVPRWSPAGDKIAIDRCDPNPPFGCEIMLIDPKGQHARQLTAGAAQEWAPDGRRLVYTHDVDMLSTVAVVDMNGHERDIAVGYGPQWSPDGRWIAYTSYTGSVPTLAAAHPDGTATHTVARNVRGSGFAWSPDSKYLAAVNGSGLRLFVVPARGGQARTVTKVDPSGVGDNDLCCPTWQQIPR